MLKSPYRAPVGVLLATASHGRSDAMTPDLAATPQVLVDFTSPPSMRHWLKTCRDRGIALLIGTTGLQRCIFRISRILIIAGKATSIVGFIKPFLCFRFAILIVVCHRV